jgi:AhpD family alkylhydroperoxidase
MLDIVTARKHYTVRELYDVTYDAIRTAPVMRKARPLGLTRPLVERIMLAVTAVNGCALCAFAHVRIALEAGLEGDEITRMLGGEMADVPSDQAPAVAFAQHYADTKGHPSTKAWQRIVAIYGIAMANGILGATRAIMWGNVAGIPASAFLHRLRGKIEPGSSLRYELSMMLATALVMPIAMIHAAASAMRGVPLAAFADEG